MTPKSIVGQRVLNLRLNRRLTALELAALAQVHRNTVYRLESGLTISIESLWKICKTLNVTIDSLLDERQVCTATQLELWPKRRRHALKLQSNPNRGSDVLYPLRARVGRERSRTTGMFIAANSSERDSGARKPATSVGRREALHELSN